MTPSSAQPGSSAPISRRRRGQPGNRARKRLLDQPDFPAAYKEEATRGAETLAYLRTIDNLDWTFLSPSALFVPGERTGKLRLGKDELLTGQNGSSVSFEDYAIAMVDEIEDPKHIRHRFTVGY